MKPKDKTLEITIKLVKKNKVPRGTSQGKKKK